MCILKRTIPDSELILNADGSIYHLNLLPHQLAETIITVGDPERVKMITSYFDKIEHQVAKREFLTHTGIYKGKRLSVISTGIGTDNIDIVFNELDALVNVDFETRQAKEDLQTLQFIRLGTTGGLQEDLAVDTVIASKFAVGMDALLHYYNDYKLGEQEEKIKKELEKLTQIAPYVVKGEENLLNKLAIGLEQGITVTCPGFYGPQNRSIRLQPKNAAFLENIHQLKWDNLRFTNFEMETAGIYGMSKLLGHQAISISVILANRIKNTFSKDPQLAVKKMIENMLDKLVNL